MWSNTQTQDLWKIFYAASRLVQSKVLFSQQIQMEIIPEKSINNLIALKLLNFTENVKYRTK